MLFRRIILCALLVGALSGLLVSAVQHWQVIPIIAAAEQFEGSAADEVAPDASAHAHSADTSAHTHDDAAWAPEDGAERHLWTAIANALTATGFALLLIPAIAAWEHLRGRPLATARNGLLWGAAGWACLFAVPALGLPPEIPGSAAAALDHRQTWWLLTAISTAIGLGLLAFVRGPARWTGAALLVLPFAVGAPHLASGPFAGHAADVATQLDALAAQFAVATTIVNAVQWLALGGLSGWAVARWVRPALMALSETPVAES